MCLVDRLISMQTDAFYIPANARLDFALAAAALAKSDLHTWHAMPVLLGIITDVDGQVDIKPVFALLRISCCIQSVCMANFWLSA